VASVNPMAGKVHVSDVDWMRAEALDQATTPPPFVFNTWLSVPSIVGNVYAPLISNLPSLIPKAVASNVATPVALVIATMFGVVS